MIRLSQGLRKSVGEQCSTRCGTRDCRASPNISLGILLDKCMYICALVSYGDSASMDVKGLLRFLGVYFVAVAIPLFVLTCQWGLGTYIQKLFARWTQSHWRWQYSKGL